jgi:predicted nucleic acid-binding Zn ribbon protein
MHRPAPISGLLSAYLRGTPVEKRLEEGRIWMVWEQAVGNRIASHAVPCAFREGVLTLTVDSAPWMQQLTYLKQELIRKVNSELRQEMVKEIQMKAGRVKVPVAPAKPWVQQRRQLSADEIAWVTEQAESVTDPELREVFERLIRKDRERQDRG